MEKAALSLRKVYVSYDEEADVLYLSFGEPQEAEDTVEVEEGTIYRLKGKEVVGITVVGLKNKTKPSIK
ncbi:MAG: DUF2283 domain-containing protein [Candidatus Baldrarchaeia archaeon]